MENTNKIVFDQSRLSTPLATAEKVKLAIIGAGSIGSVAAMCAVMMGISNITLIDFDTFSETNPTKSFAISPADIGKKKGFAIAEKLREFRRDGTFCGIHADIHSLAPAAVMGMDYIIIAVDNYDAKYFANELWREIPRRSDKRCCLILTGTDGEMSQAALFDGEGACLECYLGAPNEEAKIRHECGLAYKKQVSAGHVPTSGEASARSALRAIELMRRDMLGDRIDNNKLVRDSGKTELMKSPIPKSKSCNACKISAPKRVVPLKLSAEKSTVRELFAMLDSAEITKPTVFLPSQFILRDQCRGCGKVLDIMAPASKVLESELLCSDCTKGRLNTLELTEQESVSELTHDSLDSLGGLTLYQLGFPVGSNIPVSWDCGLSFFTCSEDATFCHENRDKELK